MLPPLPGQHHVDYLCLVYTVILCLDALCDPPYAEHHHRQGYTSIEKEREEGDLFYNFFLKKKVTGVPLQYVCTGYESILSLSMYTYIPSSQQN